MPELLLVLLAAVPSDFLPCTPGLQIEYRAGERTRVTDTVIGPEGRNLCRIERATVRPGPSKGAKSSKETEAYLRELLPDRVLTAGYAQTPLALRPPLLVAPVELGTRWRFNRARYRIAELGPCRAADRTFERCVTVEMSGEDGSSSTSRYAEGVGLVEQRFGDTSMIAVAVRLPKSERRRKSSTDARR